MDPPSRILFFLIAVIIYPIFCQENAGTNVAPALEICYNNTYMVTRQYRLPATITTLIEIIRKIEDATPSVNARELSFQLLHRFRQDGISRTHKQVDSSLGLPYSPRRMEAYKNRVQLKILTPGNAINFNNDSLNTLEACSLHYMISSTIEIQERGDENKVCNSVSQYTLRHRREAEFAEQLDATRSRSSCPIESGVVYTKWGAVKAGLVLAGIAAGFNPNPIRTTNGTLETSYASTIGGELSEVALIQPSIDKIIGNKGGWNSTLVPKYYFLESSENDHLHLTDAEIRGGLDGLLLALSIDGLKARSSNIRISQILDLYYGSGLFNDTQRACNRKKLVQNLIADDKLDQQVSLFNNYLDRESQYSYTPIKSNFPKLAQKAVESFRSYINTALNDLQCSAENEMIERVSSDVLIFIDTAWDYNIIEPFVSYIIQNIDINKFDSSYTVFDGVNCDKIVNTSKSILDFYEQYNLTQHQKYPTGFNYNKVIQTAENIMKGKLNNETDLTGQSTILLMLPHNTPSSSESDYVANKRSVEFKSTLPDLRILVAGSNSKTSYNSLVTNQNNDIFSVSDSTDETTIKETARLLVERFRKIPRNVVNPKCGSSFASGEASSFEVTQYVEPSGINYHKISSNYFYKGQNLKIRGQGYGTLKVCTSRTEANPKAGAAGSNCKDVVSNEISTDISGYCTGDSVTDCSPIYLSVQGVASQVRCNEKTCRFPGSIKYTIYLENVQCSSSSEKLLCSLLFVALLFVTRRF